MFQADTVKYSLLLKATNVKAVPSTFMADKIKTPQYTYNLTLRRVRVTTVACGEAIGITYSECVSVALGIGRAVRMRHIVNCGFSGCTIFFPHYLIKGTIFEKRKLMDIKCVF